MSEKELTELQGESQKVQDAVEKFSGRNLKAIVVVAFMAGMWATTMTLNIARIRSQQEIETEATKARVADWSAWRQEINGKVDARLQDRFTATDYRWTAILFNMGNPPNRLPDLDTVKRAQP